MTPLQRFVRLQDVLRRAVENFDSRGLSGEVDELFLERLRESTFAAGATESELELLAGSCQGLPAIEHLTLEEVRELAVYELPTGTEIDGIMSEQGKIQLPGLALTAGAPFAVIALVGLLAAAMFQFWLYFKEATGSPTFPAGATLFGVLWRSRIAYCLFLLAITTPLASGGLLAIRTLPLSRVPIFLCLPIAGLTVAVLRLAARYRHPSVAAQSQPRPYLPE